MKKGLNIFLVKKESGIWISLYYSLREAVKVEKSVQNYYLKWTKNLQNLRGNNYYTLFLLWRPPSPKYDFLLKFTKFCIFLFLRGWTVRWHQEGSVRVNFKQELSGSPPPSSPHSHTDTQGDQWQRSPLSGDPRGEPTAPFLWCNGHIVTTRSPVINHFKATLI